MSQFTIKTKQNDVLAHLIHASLDLTVILTNKFYQVQMSFISKKVTFKKITTLNMV